MVSCVTASRTEATVAETCKHCGKPIRAVNWSDGPGWTHEDQMIGQWCRLWMAEPLDTKEKR